jgi:hypothetical protein
MKLRHTWGWIAPLALALLAVASLAFVPATRAAAAGAAPITVPFDHLTTGVELDGVHRDLPCESCHLNAVFRGTPRSCGSCHVKGSLFNATPKTQTHISSTNNCAACHNTISFRPQVHFDHAQVMGSCVSCHNGTIATGMKIPPHPATTQNCAACHTVISWNPPSTVDHTQIPLAVAGFCIICHNGKDASGKSAGHVATNLECGDCHLTTTWLGANFDHTGITTGCATCHNGTKAVGKQGSHMPTTIACETCHTTGIGTKTPSWVPSKFDHTQMTVTTCTTCHSGTVRISTGFVSGEPSNHVPVPSASPTIDCSLCHGNNPSAETWTVLAASIPTLHSGLNTKNCLMCHAGQTFAGVPAPYIPMSISGVSPAKKTPLVPLHIPVLTGTDCSACHGAAYQAGGFGPATAMSAATHAFVSTTCDTCHDTGRSFYVGGGTPLQLRPPNHVNSTDPRMATGDCSLCHETKDWLSTVLPSGHMPNPANQSCVTCHAAAPNDYTAATLAALSALHTGIRANCGLCHGDTAVALTWANNYTPKDAVLAPSHIPYLSGTDCSSCHAATYITGGFGPTNMSAAKHAFVPTACDTCHEAGLSFYLGASTPALQGRPADHMSPIGTPQQQTADCSSCHTTIDWSTNIMPVGHMPNPGNQACATCHTAITGSIASYATMASISVLHTGISGNCGLCHGTPAGALTFYNNNDNPKSAVLSPAHIPYLNGADCSSCHAANYVAGGFGPTNMSPAKHAFVPTTCDTCHDTGKNFYLGASTPVLQLRPQNHISTPNPASQATGDCSLCHNTTVWTTPTTLPNGHMPIPGTQTCTVCHTGNLTTPAGYATLASIPVMHTGISSGCSQCHGGATQLTFYNNYNNLKAAAGLAPGHIPAFTGQDCSSCHKPNYVMGGFGPMNMTQATHAGVGTVCKTCHEAGLSFYMGAASPGLQGRPANHTSAQMAAPNDCAGCHTTANWNSGSLPANHMPNPGNLACSICHIASPANYTTLAANSVMHTGITGSQCAQCHGGTAAALTWYNNFTPKSAVLSPSHIPYLSGTSCGSCHSSTSYAAGTFGPMNMSATTHAFVTTNCVTCHEKGVSFYMGAANPALQGRPADHTSGQMVAPNNCSLCHTTANWNSTALPAGHMPNPGNQACAVCHTAAPANYKTLATNAVLHTGIGSGCITCHGAPNAAPPVYYLNFTPKDAVLSPVHIPSSSTPCESCHTVSFTSFSGTTMTAGKHTALLAVTGGTCDQCHDLRTLKFYGVNNLTTRPNGHYVGRDCNGCHSPNNWGGGSATRRQVAAAKVPTRSTVGTVVTASAARAGWGRFGGRIGAERGGLPGAIPSGTAAGLTGQKPSHAGVTGNCVSCHNGVLAAGKGPAHITSNSMCQNCHTTIAWLPARFDHQGVMARCSSCHNGVVALGKPNLHVQTNQDCSTCHGTITWTAAVFSHVGISAVCQSCHNGITATGKQVQHARTTLDCSSCHNTFNWTVVSVPTRPRPVIPTPRGPASGPTR